MNSRVVQSKWSRSIGLQLLAVMLVALLLGATFLTLPTQGEDESLKIHDATQVCAFVTTGNTAYLFDPFVMSTDPLLSWVVLLPVVPVFGSAVWAARLPHLLLWVLSVGLIYQCLSLLFSRKGAFMTAITFAVSGSFSVLVLAHGKAIFIFGLLLFFSLQLKNGLPDLETKPGIRAYLVGQLALLITFLSYNSSALLIASYAAVVVLPYLGAGRFRWSSLRRVVLIHLPILLVYTVYYGWYLGYPMWLFQSGQTDELIGFAARYQSRVEGFQIQFDSLVQNIKGINGYYLPHLSLLLFGAGSYYLYRRQRWMFLVLLPYTLFMCFVMGGWTLTHFLPTFLCVGPVGWAWLLDRMESRPGLQISAATLMWILVATWSIYFHVIRYTPATYPHDRFRTFHAYVFRHENILHESQ